MHHPTDKIAHTTAFALPVMKHWLERELATWFVMTEANYTGVLYMLICV